MANTITADEISGALFAGHVGHVIAGSSRSTERCWNWWLTSTWRYWKIIRSCMNSSLTLTSWRETWSATARFARGTAEELATPAACLPSWECIPLAT